MYKNNLFYDVDLAFPSPEVDMPEEKYLEEVKNLAMTFSLEMQKLIDIAKAYGFTTVFDKCKEETSYSAKPHISIVMYQLHSIVHNISIEAHLCRQFECRGELRPASIIMELGFYGYKEKNAFRELYTNYRRLIELLVKRVGVPIKVENVVYTYKGNKTLAQIDSYFESDWTEDTTSTFSLAAEFTQESSYESMVKTFLSLLIIYDSALNYLSDRKSPDKILNYYFKLMNDV